MVKRGITSHLISAGLLCNPSGAVLHMQMLVLTVSCYTDLSVIWFNVDVYLFNRKYWISQLLDLILTCLDNTARMKT